MGIVFYFTIFCSLDSNYVVFVTRHYISFMIFVNDFMRSKIFDIFSVRINLEILKKCKL